MRITFALLFAVLMGLNGFLAVENFMDGHTGLGTMNAVATIWCLLGLIKNFGEEN
jgi:hypothetical protein